MRDDKNIEFEGWMTKWLLDKKNFVKESTYATYLILADKHLIPAFQKMRLQAFNRQIIQGFVLKKHQDGLSIKTIKDIVVVLKSSLQAAMEQNIIDYFDIKVIYPKPEKGTAIETFHRKEQQLILNYCRKNLSNRSIGIMLSLLIGIRIGELAALQWKHIDFKNHLLSIEQTLQRIYLKQKSIGSTKVVITTPKTPTSIRKIPLNREFLKLLKQFKGGENDFILSGNANYVEPKTLRTYFKKILEKTNTRNLKFHSLRHTFATNCIALKVDPKTVSELLGHSSVQTTLNLYVHPSLKEKTKCIDLIYKSLL